MRQGLLFVHNIHLNNTHISNLYHINQKQIHVDLSINHTMYNYSDEEII